MPALPTCLRNTLLAWTTTLRLKQIALTSMFGSVQPGSCRAAWELSCSVLFTRPSFWVTSKVSCTTARQSSKMLAAVWFCRQRAASTTDLFTKHLWGAHCVHGKGLSEHWGNSLRGLGTHPTRLADRLSLISCMRGGSNNKIDQGDEFPKVETTRNKQNIKRTELFQILTIHAAR